MNNRFKGLTPEQIAERRKKDLQAAVMPARVSRQDYIAKEAIERVEEAMAAPLWQIQPAAPEQQPHPRAFEMDTLLSAEDVPVLIPPEEQLSLPTTGAVALPVADTAPTEPQAGPVGEAVVNYRDRGNVMQKRALIAKYQGAWDSMESCFKNAHANGLHKAAKAALRGEWFECDAVAWAKKQGNMKDTKDSASTSLGTVWAART